MQLLIKNMVSSRCQIIVKGEIERLGFHYSDVQLGLADIKESLSPSQLLMLDKALQNWGLGLMSNKTTILIEKIKHIIIELVHHTTDLPKINFSDYLTRQLYCDCSYLYDYTYLSNIFSRITGRTIEQFHILHKIERTKELITYGELNLTEIADKLHYSSVSHLSNQFKKVTGQTPTLFRLQNPQSRIALEYL